MQIQSYYNSIPEYLKTAPTKDEIALLIIGIAAGIIGGVVTSYPNIKVSDVTFIVAVAFGVTLALIDITANRYFAHTREQRLAVIDQDIRTKTEELEKIRTFYPSNTQPEDLKNEEKELRQQYAACIKEDLKDKAKILSAKIIEIREKHPEIVRLKDAILQLEAEEQALIF